MTETIVAAAIQIDGVTISLPQPSRLRGSKKRSSCRSELRADASVVG